MDKPIEDCGPLTVEDVRNRVEAIRAKAYDDEVAHGMEDQLHQDVLRFLSVRGNELAREALRTLDIDFSRWCA